MDSNSCYRAIALTLWCGGKITITMIKGIINSQGSVEKPTPLGLSLLADVQC